MSLREDLDAAIANSLFAGTYARRIEELRAIYGHAIQIVPLDEVQRFNCFAFATGVSDMPRYSKLVDAHQNSALVDSSFVRGLIDDGVLKAVDGAVPGGVAIYCAGDKIMHAARVLDASGRVMSKWGGGDLHAHDLWEAPAGYGDTILYFALPDSEAIMARLESLLAG